MQTETQRKDQNGYSRLFTVSGQMVKMIKFVQSWLKVRAGGERAGRGPENRPRQNSYSKTIR